MLKPSEPSALSRNPSPFPPSVVDRINLQESDENFRPHTWDDAKQIIIENRLQDFRRWPSEIRRYLDWSKSIKDEYASVQNYVMQERLGWILSSRTTNASGPLFDSVSPTAFGDPSDYKVLPNDWPYAFEPGITHLIVWLKQRLETEPMRGDITQSSRLQVEEFVRWKFENRVQHLNDCQDKIRWFKNWTVLQSVPGMDHIHVLVHDVPEDIIREWIEED